MSDVTKLSSQSVSTKSTYWHYVLSKSKMLIQRQGLIKNFNSQMEKSSIRGKQIWNKENKNLKVNSPNLGVWFYLNKKQITHKKL